MVHLGKPMDGYESKDKDSKELGTRGGVISMINSMV
jgi:hypothetical protein